MLLCYHEAGEQLGRVRLQGSDLARATAAASPRLQVKGARHPMLDALLGAGWVGCVRVGGELGEEEGWVREWGGN